MSKEIGEKIKWHRGRRELIKDNVHLIECLECNEFKKMDEFGVNNATRLKISSLCKLCKKEYNRSYKADYKYNRELNRVSSITL